MNVIAFSNFRPNSSHQSKSKIFGIPPTVEPLFGTLGRSLNPMRLEMLNEKCPLEHKWLRNVRPFRQRFCSLARKFSGLSLEELSLRINEHPDILKLGSYPSFKSFYPITPKFLLNLETDISKIFEYCSSGFLLGGIGVPTEIIAKAIADICDAQNEYNQFIEWCMQYRFGGCFEY